MISSVSSHNIMQNTKPSFSRSLNIDTVRAVFAHKPLDIADGLRCRKVCKVWKNALSDQKFLQQLAMKSLHFVDVGIVLPASPDFQMLSEKLEISGLKFVGGPPEALLLYVLHGGKIEAEQQSLTLEMSLIIKLK